jgi:hypothetical protein
VDVPDNVLEKRIHLAEVRAKRKSKAFLLRQATQGGMESTLRGDGTHLSGKASGSPGSTTESQALRSHVVGDQAAHFFE